MRFITLTKCPHCGATLDYDKFAFPINTPLWKCFRCSRMVHVRWVREWETMSPAQRAWHFTKQVFQGVLCGSFVSFFLFGSLNFSTLSSKDAKPPFHLQYGVQACFIGFFCWFALLLYINIRMIRRSKLRTHSSAYREQLRAVGYSFRADSSSLPAA